MLYNLLVVGILYRFLCTLCVWGGVCVCGVRVGGGVSVYVFYVWVMIKGCVCVCDGCEGICIFWQKLLVLACLDAAWCCGVEYSECCWWGTGRLWVLRLFGEFVLVMSFEVFHGLYLLILMYVFSFLYAFCFIFQYIFIIYYCHFVFVL